MHIAIAPFRLKDSDVCAAFFAVMESDGSHQVYEALKAYR